MNKRFQYDPVTVAAAALAYEQQKVGAKHRVTLPMIAKRFGISTSCIINFRRYGSACSPKCGEMI